MKNAVVTILLGLLLFPVAACADTSTDRSFESPEAMKAVAGGELLYPDVLPFTPTYRVISGYQYQRTGTWDYYMSFRNYDLTMTVANADAYHLLAEGSPIVECMDIRAFEPKHRDGSLKKPNRQTETDAYHRAINEKGDAAWEIDGVIVPHSGAFTEVSASYRLSNGDNIAYPGYVFVSAHAALMRGGVLYTVEMQVNGHANETEASMRKTVDEMLKAVVTGMIRSERYANRAERISIGVNRTKTGRIISIALDENQSTPYRWRHDISDAGLVRFVDDEILWPEVPSDQSGAGGEVHVFYFEALRAGECAINMHWESIDGHRMGDPESYAVVIED